VEASCEHGESNGRGVDLERPRSPRLYIAFAVSNGPRYQPEKCGRVTQDNLAGSR
jgi:hypothetical protein